ncbi:MAG: hypothetical protein KGH84_09260, partial [Paracoccaceae bacterium]|nr:hypothetical protein [Paracoccaceae bacterium]
AYSVTSGGLTATFSAGTFTTLNQRNGTITTGTTVGSASLDAAANGLGVLSSTPNDSPTVDGSNTKDFITIVLSQAATLTSATLGFTGNGQGFSLLTDTSGNGAIGVGDSISGNLFVRSSSGGAYSAFVPTVGTVYAFAATAGWQSWNLSSISVSYTPPPPPAPVPLPATGVMLLAALGGLRLIRRRRATAS